MSEQYYDVLIIGAGLSGIGAACHIAKECPNRRLAILERRDRLGGTWDLFRYPGIRSDSDMFSFGYRFRPWNGVKVLADGPSIRHYIQSTAEEFGLKDKIHCGLKVTSADWSSEQQRWNITTYHEASGQARRYSCNFLICATGYYDHDAGFRPKFPEEENFNGDIIHPQQWPEDLDYKDKKVVVIGSGATAITLVPSMVESGGKVTLLQRSPSYVFSIPSEDKLTALLAKIFPKKLIYGMTRWRNIRLHRLLYIVCRKCPGLMRKVLISHMRKRLGPNIEERHFTPKYMPWDERLCVVPNSDLFNVIREGRASIETDHIDRFTESGILLKSGTELEADIIITATGLQLQMLGGMQLSVDGEVRPFNQQMIYKSVLVERMPNLAWMFGYTNAPWTLKVDIAARYICRLLNHMDKHQLGVAIPFDHEGNATTDGILDSLKSGYVQRSMGAFPRQGRTHPWQLIMHYAYDRKILLKDAIHDEHLQFFPVRAKTSHKEQPQPSAA